VRKLSPDAHAEVDSPHPDKKRIKVEYLRLGKRFSIPVA
jgi:hypothetical protein